MGTREAITWMVGQLEELTVKRLAWGSIWDYEQECACATGALLPVELRAVVRDDVSLVVRSHYRGFLRTSVADWAKDKGLDFGLIAQVERLNDEFQGTSAQRYTHVINELRRIARLPSEDVEAWAKERGDQ